MMITDNADYLNKVNDFHLHVSQVRLSWTDDGVTLVCQREECKVGIYWWQKEIPYMCTPEVAAQLRNNHVRGEW